MKLTSIILQCVFGLLFFSCSEEKDPIPPFHPFEVRSDLTLESLVSDGYRLSGTPCGQPIFSKTIGDTTISYDLSRIDCKSYEGKHEREPLYLEEIEMSVDTAKSVQNEIEIEPQPKEPWFQKYVDANPYYPFDPDSIKNCFSDIRWRGFQMGLVNLDSNEIISMLKSYDGTITESDWNTKIGGIITVYYEPLDIIFLCSIRPKEQDEIYNESEIYNWFFEIRSAIPMLDHERIEEDRKRKIKIQEFYDSE